MKSFFSASVYNTHSLVNTKFSPMEVNSGMPEITPQESYFAHSHIGCDETGSSDFFGPLCVVSCYIDKKDYEWLIELGVKDPKQYTDQEIIPIAREIKDRIIYSLLILDNSHYNEMASEGNNLANIKAKLYNQAVTNVIQKTNMNVATKAVPQFVSPKTYYNYLKNEVIVVKDLTFELKAEEKYIAIMCANILSRYAYLQYFSNMSKSLKTRLPRGNTTSCESIAVELAKRYGEKMLFKVTKTNMTGFKRVKEALKKTDN